MLTIVTVVDQALSIVVRRITGREADANLEVSAWRCGWAKFLEGLDNPMKVVGNFDSPKYSCWWGTPGRFRNRVVSRRLPAAAGPATTLVLSPPHN
jgi:hypothetical protein